MGIAARWALGMEGPRVLSGSHTPGVPQRWTITLEMLSPAGLRDRVVLRPKEKTTLHGVDQLMQEMIRDFQKEHGLEHVQWTAISR